MYKSCTSFVKFIPKYFSLFDSIANGIVFLISSFGCSLLAYRNTVERNTMYTTVYIDFVSCNLAEFISYYGFF